MSQRRGRKATLAGAPESVKIDSMRISTVPEDLYFLAGPAALKKKN
jgi:hypothetical protein